MRHSENDFQVLLYMSALLLGLFIKSNDVLAQDQLAQDEFAGLTVSEAQELDTLRGQNGHTQIVVQSNQELNATVTGSTFNVGTINGGAVTIADHALDNFSGVGVFNIVTGNNNAVDAAVGITFNLQ